MPSQKVQKLTEDIAKLSPQGQKLIKAVVTGDTSEIIPAGDNFEVVAEKQDAAQVAIAIDDISKSTASSLETLTQEIKKLNEMIKDGYENDSTYREQFKVTDLEKKKLKLIKDRIMSMPSNIQLADKLKTLRAERKDKQLSLSDYLLELERMTGANQLELFNGEVYEIKKTAKLIKTKSFKK